MKRSLVQILHGIANLLQDSGIRAMELGRDAHYEFLNDPAVMALIELKGNKAYLYGVEVVRSHKVPSKEVRFSIPK